MPPLCGLFVRSFFSSSFLFRSKWHTFHKFSNFRPAALLTRNKMFSSSSFSAGVCLTYATKWRKIYKLNLLVFSIPFDVILRNTTKCRSKTWRRKNKWKTDNFFLSELGQHNFAIKIKFLINYYEFYEIGHRCLNSLERRPMKMERLRDVQR